MAISSPTRAFNSDDFPTFTLPIIPTLGLSFNFLYLFKGSKPSLLR